MEPNKDKAKLKIWLRGTGPGKADITCSGWEGGKDIQFAIKTSDDDKYLNPIKIKLKDGGDKYKVVFNGGKRPVTPTAEMIELAGGTLVIHLPKFLVRAIYNNLAESKLKVEVWEVFWESDDSSNPKPKPVAGSEQDGVIRPDNQHRVNITKGDDSADRSEIVMIFGEDEETKAQPQEEPEAAPAPGPEKPAESGSQTAGAGGAGAGETTESSAGSPESAEGAAGGNSAVRDNEQSAAGPDDAGQDSSAQTGEPPAERSEEPSEKPAGKPFPWKKILLAILILLILAGLGFGGWLLWNKYGSKLLDKGRSLFSSPAKTEAPAKPADPCGIDTADDELKFISRCAGESADDARLRKIIAESKAHEKCGIAKRIYLSKVYSDGGWSLEYAKEFDPALGGSKCFPVNAEDAAYWYRQAEDLGVELDDATSKHVAELGSAGSK